MCLALPEKAVDIDEATDTATVARDEVTIDVSLAPVDNGVVGELVLIQAGYALNKVSPAEAARAAGLFAEAGTGTKTAL